MPSESLNFFQTLLVPQDWTLTAIATSIAIVAAFLLVVFTFAPFWQHYRKKKLLESEFGAELFDVDTLDRSTRYYIPPNCCSVDPSQEAEIRYVVTTEEKLFAAVDKYLAQDTPNRHLLLLADSGMGKSSFLLNYYARNQRLPKRKRQRIEVVPLGIPDVHTYIERIDNKRDTVIFLDAFDEDTKAIKDHHRRVLDLMYAGSAFKRVLITCRTQFFPSDEEIPRETGIARVGPRKTGEQGSYEFWKLYLSPFNDQQVAKLLRKRYPYWLWHKRKKARELVKKIPLLSARPMLLSFIPDLIESEAKFEYSFQLYEVMVERWLERESAWVDKEALRAFSESLAVDLYVNRQSRGAERIPRPELADLAKEWNIPLDDWQLSGRSLLNRDALGNYKFSHRSIMEYLFVKRFTQDDLACQGIPWTGQMKAFLREMIEFYLSADKTIPFDIKKSGLYRFQEPLRIKPDNQLHEKVVKKMVKSLGYFDSNLHKDGKGVLHLFELIVKSGTKVVLDLSTGLMWQQDGTDKYMTLKEAEFYVHKLNKGSYGGYNDWRLPNLEEAMSLMEPQKRNGDLYFDPVFDKKQRYIWTVDKKNPSFSWVVDFRKGQCGSYRIDGSYLFVRAVR